MIRRDTADETRRSITAPASPAAWAASESAYIPRGSAHVSAGFGGAPRDFHFLLLSQMTMLTFAAAIEPLRAANQLSGQCLYRWHAHSEDGSPVACSNRLEIAVDEILGQLDRRAVAVVCAGIGGATAAGPAALGWLRGHARRGGLVVGLGTGAFTLARAGLLAGRRATVHWEHRAAFAESYPDVALSDALFERDGPVTTCAGGGASLDLMTALIAEHHGEDLADAVAELCLHPRRRQGELAQRRSLAASVGARQPVLVRVIRRMQQRLADPCDMRELMQGEVLSQRQIERLFRQHLGTSPLRYFRDLRLDHARNLLLETDMRLVDVASAAGFGGVGNFSRSYRACFGALPSAARERPRRG